VAGLNALSPKAFYSEGLPQEDSMRISVHHLAIVFALLGSGLAAAQEKSQQNAADEAQVKGDLAAAKDSQDKNKITAAEKLLEDAAENAKTKTAGATPAAPPATDPTDGQALPAASGPALVNGSVDAPGASPQTQDTPAKYSAKNDADDKTPIMAWPVPLSDEQKQAIRDRLAQAGSPVSLAAKPSDSLPDWVALQGVMQDLPPDLAEKIPFLRDYKYVNTADKILIVNPRERIVVGEIAK
jgi:hypothetical protein